MIDARPRRLFFALWPDDAVRAALRAWVRNHAGGVQGVAVQADNLHITLLFLGTVDASVLACLEQAVDQIALSPCELVLDHIDYFPKPQVVYAGARDVPATIDAWVMQLRAAATRCGLSPDERPFVAHTTLLRKQRQRPPVLPFDPIPWSVDGLVLVASDTRPEGVQYTVIKRWGCAGRVNL